MILGTRVFDTSLPTFLYDYSIQDGNPIFLKTNIHGGSTFTPNFKRKRNPGYKFVVPCKYKRMGLTWFFPTREELQIVNGPSSSLPQKSVSDPGDFLYVRKFKGSRSSVVISHTSSFRVYKGRGDRQNEVHHLRTKKLSINSCNSLPSTFFLLQNKTGRLYFHQATIHRSSTVTFCPLLYNYKYRSPTGSKKACTLTLRIGLFIFNTRIR